MTTKAFGRLTAPALTAVALLLAALAAAADTATEIDRDVDNALSKLYANSKSASELAKAAEGVLVFPKVIKGGLVVGGQYGEGALRVGGSTRGYYRTVAASYGLT
jgi:lipid-binding SYLF domain-containing protein